MRSVIFDTTLDLKCSLPEIKSSFLVLLKKRNIENKVQYEEKKLQILRVIKKKLEDELLGNSISSSTQINIAPSKSIIVSILYWLLIIVGLLQQAVGSYLFAQTLFSVIPGISAGFLTVICTVYVILDAIIFYAFSASFLKDALNLPRCSNTLGSLYKIYNEQILITTELNENLSKLSVLKINNQNYEYYVELVILMNQDLRTKNQNMQEYSYSHCNNILKYGVIVFGLLSTIASYYYLGIAFAAFITPITGAFIASIMIYLTIISGLSFYYAIGVTGIMRLVDPHKKEFDALKIKLIKFTELYQNDLKDVLAIKNEINQATRQTGNSKYVLRIFDTTVQDGVFVEVPSKSLYKM